MRADLPSTKDDLLDAFDAAWQQPVPPRLDDFLPPRSSPAFPDVLLGLVRIDLAHRTRAGQQPRVEDYLARFPQLRQGDALLTLVLLERDLPRRHDPAFQSQEYPARFPELAAELEAALLTVDVTPAASAKVTPNAGSNGVLLDLREHVLLDCVGRGGMGEVYRGRDPALERSLAVKVLRPELRGNAEAVRRFQQEARINGLLQHPSIVPVHNLGRLPDGRLYFTMKLVRGRTLADILGERTNAPPELLGIFEKVAQALAYAHSRKVIHRDLKPGNVMVGAFGEVQVMDWGLAKLLARPTPTEPPAAETTMGVLFTTRSAESTGEEHSPTGVVGTPAYMAPEQARGAGEDMDERADVFGLGGILCAMLTGQPPYTGRGREEVLCKAAAGELADAFARLEASGADGELVRLCKACLAAVKEDRPADAGVVAAQVTAYLVGVQQRLHAAEVERAAAQARAEEAAKKAALELRARRTLLILATAILLVLLGGIVGTTWGLLRADRARDSESQQRQLAEAKQREAEQQKERAQNAEKETLEDYRASADDAIEQLIGSKPVLGPQEKSYLEKTLKRWQAFAARTGDDERSRAIRAEGELRVASLRHKLGQTAQALAGYRKALAQWEKLADDFPAVPAYRQEWAGTHNNLGLLLAHQNQSDKAADHYGMALAIKQKLSNDFPDVLAYRQSLARSHNNLGNLLQDLKQPEQAAEQYGEALAIQQKLADDFPAVPTYRQELAGTRTNLGNLLKAQKQWDKAAEQYRKALPIQQKLSNDFPDVPAYRQRLANSHNSLGNLLKSQNQAGKAAEQFHKALAIQHKLADGFPAVPAYRQDLARSQNNLARLLEDQNQPVQAGAQYRKALAIRQKLADDFPTVPAYRLELAGSHLELGLVLKGQNKPEQAAEQYGKALAIYQKLTDDFPTMPAYRTDLATSHNNLGNLLQDLKQPEQAAEQYGKALAIQQKLADEVPTVAAYRQDLARSYNNLGNLLLSQNRADKAAEHYRMALTIRQKLADDFPAERKYQGELGHSCSSFARLLLLSGKPQESLPWFDRAIRTLTDIHQQDTRNITSRLFLRNSHWGRAQTYDLLQKHAEAVKDWTRAIELSPPTDRPDLRVRRADSCVRAGQVAEALAEVAELRKFTTMPAAGWYDFARIYAVASDKAADKKQQYADQAMDMLRHAVQAGYKNAAHMAKDKDLDVLRERDDFKKLMQALPQPKEKQPAGVPTKT
jgi:tetratricopeptide (TPR) repeat protein/tRNA A-37 threonylcarbamoyl transferase component Bud32